MNKIKNWMIALVLAVSVGGTFASLLPATTVSAAVNCSGKGAFLTFPSWYRGIATPNKDNDGCDIKAPTDSDKLSGFIWQIVLNVIDIGLQLVGYISAFFILYGGFLFLTSSGEVAGIAKAKTTITNAVIGLVISIASVAIVNLVFGIIS